MKRALTQVLMQPLDVAVCLGNRLTVSGAKMPVKARFLGRGGDEILSREARVDSWLFIFSLNKDM